MSSVPMLIVGRDGVIRHANGPAVETLGHAAGLRCAEVVRAQDNHGARVCRTGCPAQSFGARLGRDRCISARVRGENWELACSAMGQEIAVALVPAQATESAAAEQLTPREKDVMALVARGMSTAVIAKHLGLAPATVRTHVEHVRQKLGARTRAEAVARLLRDAVPAAK